MTKEEMQDALLQEALESWEHYKQTGLHVTGEELSAWLKTWGTDDEKAPLEPLR